MCAYLAGVMDRKQTSIKPLKQQVRDETSKEELEEEKTWKARDRACLGGVTHTTPRYGSRRNVRLPQSSAVSCRRSAPSLGALAAT